MAEDKLREEAMAKFFREEELENVSTASYKANESSDTTITPPEWKNFEKTQEVKDLDLTKSTLRESSGEDSLDDIIQEGFEMISVDDAL